MSEYRERGPLDSPEIEDGDSRFFGVDLRDPRTLPPGMLNNGRNLRFYDLVPDRRRGVIKPAWANRVDASASEKINPWGIGYGIQVFKDPNSTQWQILAADGLAWRSRPANQPLSIPLPTGVKLLSRCVFVQAFDKFYCFRGRYLAPLRLQNFDDGFEDLLPHYDSTATYDAAIVALGQLADEIAYGPFIAVSSITRTGGTATVVTTDPHGYITGADITHMGAAQAEYNVRANITVVDEVTYTYPVSGAPASPATGTIKASNMGYYYKALGSRITLGAGELTSSSTTATVHHTAHGFLAGQYVTIAGATPSAYNGTYVIAVPDADHFTYTFAGSGTSPATGTITAQTSLVSAGQSPDTNPEAWQRVYNVLPNSDGAIYVNNCLLAWTAFEPSSADNYATFNGGQFKKTDYLVRTDFLDDIHFDFSDEFRINQGSEDEIVECLKFTDDTVIVFKSGSWGVILNVGLDISQVKLDMRNQVYGLSAPRACVLAGNDVLFVADKRGIVSIRQSENGKLIGVDVPLSAPIQSIINRINWPAAGGIRMDNWNSRLYIAVPIDGAASNNAQLVYDFVSAAKAGLDPLNAQGWTPIDDGTAIVPQEYYRMKVDKAEQLFFLGTDGYVNQVEASDAGDQVADADADSGLVWEEIETLQLSRSYLATNRSQIRPDGAAVVLATWNPEYSVAVLFSGVNKRTALATDKTRDRTKYYRPFNAPRWDPTNVNFDHDTPDRQDYSVPIGENGVSLGDGLQADLFQEVIEPFHLSGKQGRSFQVEVMNARGRLKLLAVNLSGLPGRNRKGTLA